MKELQGVFAAMLTPLTAQGEPEIGTLCEMTEFMIQGGVTGLFPVSNVGGMIHLTPEEKVRVVEAVVRQTRGRVPVFAGANSSSTHGAVALGRRYAEAGADGCVLSAPYYFPYPQRVILEGLQCAVRQIPLPVTLYNIPKYAGAIELDSFRALMQEKNVVAVKDSSGSVAELLRLLTMRDEVRSDFSVLVGWEEMLVTALDAGAQGCMTGSCCVFPEIMRAIYEDVRAGRMDRARRLQRIIAQATDAFAKVFFPLGFQWAMEARGFCLGPYPVRFDESVYAAERAQIEAAVHAALDAYHSAG